MTSGALQQSTSPQSGIKSFRSLIRTGARQCVVDLRCPVSYERDTPVSLKCAQGIDKHSPLSSPSPPPPPLPLSIACSLVRSLANQAEVSGVRLTRRWVAYSHSLIVREGETHPLSHSLTLSLTHTQSLSLTHWLTLQLSHSRRDNAGGYFRSGVDTAALFLPTGKQLVYVVNKVRSSLPGCSSLPSEEGTPPTF